MILRRYLSLLLLVVLLVPSLVYAQDELPASQEVILTASDGLAIIGDFYMPDNSTDGEAVPAVLLLHMLNSRRQAWEPLVPVLVDAGIAVLAIDMRGHGATGGSRDWELAEQDVQTAIDWLREQEHIGSVAIVGGSIGSNLALRGAANDPDITTAIALSPGLDYRGVTTADAIETIGDRPVLLVASRADRPSGLDTPALFDLTTGEAEIRLYTGNRHGTSLLAQNDALLHQITEWILEHS